MQYHVLSFEGPDPYSRVGGLATRVDGLTEALVEHGHETHLWFVGQADLPGHESRGGLHLHRWCQWMSQYHRGNVYTCEDEKVAEYAATLPPHLVANSLMPHLRTGGRAVVLAEEWQTVDALLTIDRLLRLAGVRQQVSLFWNANNTFGFDDIDWPRLRAAASITTVSRYMKHRMQAWGVDALVIPNGLAPDAFAPPDLAAVAQLRLEHTERTIITKMARWDPDKRWIESIATIAELKRAGWKPLLIARGGTEAHGTEVMATAHAAGLEVIERDNVSGGVSGFLEAIRGVNGADIVSLRTPVDPESRRVLFRGADAVLANSSHEPFGLVGLETMAVGGMACTGCSGEDYAVAGQNALVLQTGDPREFLGLYGQLRQDPTHMQTMRKAGSRTARQYAWSEVLRRNLLPWIELQRVTERADAHLATGSAHGEGTVRYDLPEAPPYGVI